MRLIIPEIMVIENTETIAEVFDEAIFNCQLENV